MNDVEFLMTEWHLKQLVERLQGLDMSGYRRALDRGARPGLAIDSEAARELAGAACAFQEASRRVLRARLLSF